MNQEPVIRKAGELLLDYLREELAPVALSAPDMLTMGYPGLEGEFQLGLCLYELEEVRPDGPPAMTRLSEDTRRLPSLALALHFMAFANRNTAFHSMEMAQELLLVEAVLRAAHSFPGLELEGQRLRLALCPLTRGEKTALWQSLNAPLQPAAYLTLEPVRIPSSRIRRVPPVREVEVSARRGGRGAEPL